MHGYSGTPLPQKLGLKPGLKVYVDGAPDHLDELLGGSTYATRLPRQIDVTLLSAPRWPGWRSGCPW